MLSKIQEEEKKKKILLVAKCFLKTGGSMTEVEALTGISKSSAQRYLHDKEIITMLGKETYTIIQNKLMANKQEALSKGGQNYAINNEFTKDELGRFTGSKQR